MTWSRFAGLLRRLAHDDARVASRSENAALEAAVAPRGLPQGMQPFVGRGQDVPAGMVRVGELTELGGSSLLLPIRTPPVHSLTLGSTGSGKTRAMLALIIARLAEFARSPNADRLLVLDPKGELAGLVKAAVLSLLPTLTEAQAERLLSAFVVVDPFSTDALVPMNVLRAEAGVDPEAAAWDLTGLVAELAGAPMGVHQDAFVFNVLTLGFELAATEPGCTLLDVARLLDAPAELQAAARCSRNPAVRSYFETQRLPAASLHGVRARLTRLLRLAGARRMLGARTCTAFGRLLAANVTIIDLGSAPVGSLDIGNFWTGLFMGRLVRAIFARTGAEPTATVYVDEWQNVVGAARWVAEDFERILAVSRSRRVHLALVSQSLDAVRAIRTALPHVALTNVDWRFLFRVEADDARAASQLLPVTGRRLREPPAPWETPAGSPFLSATEERAALVERVTRLPPREFLFADRRSGDVGVFARTVDVEVGRPRMASASRNRRVRTGSLALQADAAPPLRDAAPVREGVLVRERGPALPPEHQRDLPRRRSRL